MLRLLTGFDSKPYIQVAIKRKLTTANLVFSEIAHGLGFAHLQSFSQLFKTKTNVFRRWGSDNRLIN